MADPEMMKELRGKEVAKQPEELLKSFKLPKTTEQMEAEMKALIETQKKTTKKKKQESDSSSDSDEQSNDEKND